LGIGDWAQSPIPNPPSPIPNPQSPKRLDEYYTKEIKSYLNHKKNKIISEKIFLFFFVGTILIY